VCWEDGFILNIELTNSRSQFPPHSTPSPASDSISASLRIFESTSKSSGRGVQLRNRRSPCSLQPFRCLPTPCNVWMLIKFSELTSVQEIVLPPKLKGDCYGKYEPQSHNKDETSNTPLSLRLPCKKLWKSSKV